MQRRRGGVGGEHRPGGAHRGPGGRAHRRRPGRAVVVLMFTVVASYRQNVRAYPSGGGDYEVANT
ncbi:hypothetical protein, partial [Streptomyces sp. NPDC047968]|uniref:hypothetical protein n=1 Tax=Streptomyces sp. NPDC047968 TaxID=3155382 RepID=UPI0034445CF1